MKVFTNFSEVNCQLIYRINRFNSSSFNHLFGRLICFPNVGYIQIISSKLKNMNDGENVLKKRTFSILIKQIQMNFDTEQPESSFKLLREAKHTFGIIQKSQLRRSSLLDQKREPHSNEKSKEKDFEKNGYLTGSLSQGLQIKQSVKNCLQIVGCC